MGTLRVRNAKLASYQLINGPASNPTGIINAFWYFPDVNGQRLLQILGSGTNSTTVALEPGTDFFILQSDQNFRSYGFRYTPEGSDVEVTIGAPLTPDRDEPFSQLVVKPFTSELFNEQEVSARIPFPGPGEESTTNLINVDTTPGGGADGGGDDGGNDGGNDNGIELVPLNEIGFTDVSARTGAGYTPSVYVGNQGAENELDSRKRGTTAKRDVSTDGPKRFGGFDGDDREKWTEDDGFVNPDTSNIIDIRGRLSDNLVNQEEGAPVGSPDRKDEYQFRWNGPDTTLRFRPTTQPGWGISVRSIDINGQPNSGRGSLANYNRDLGEAPLESGRYKPTINVPVRQGERINVRIRRDSGAPSGTYRIFVRD
jgi:hypothetical protein